MRRWAAVAATVAAGLTVVGCGGGNGVSTGPPTSSTDAGPRVEFVTLGSTETSGERLHDPLRTAWPQLVYRTSLPIRAQYVNLGSARSTVANGVDQQLPEALALKPTIATIWFGVSDAFAATPLDQYQAALTHTVTALRSVGSRVLVVIGPGPSDGDVDVAPYNARARAVAATTHAELVDLGEADARTDDAQQAVAAAVTKAIGPVS